MKKVKGQKQSATTSFFSGKNAVLFVTLLVVASIAGYLGYKYFEVIRDQIAYKQKADLDSNLPTVSPTPSPTPIILAPGIGDYTVSHPKGIGPRITNVSFNPLDIKKGDTIMISTNLFSDSNISSLVGILETDHQKTELNFTKTATNGVQQTWSTQLTVSDSLWYTYILTITARNPQGKTTVQVAPRS